MLKKDTTMDEDLYIAQLYRIDLTDKAKLFFTHPVFLYIRIDGLPFTITRK